jgi:hypothetical protein
MKKGIVIAASIIFLMILIFRMFYTHFDRVRTEKLSYVEKLNFEFSGRIDSVKLLNSRKNGLLFFHIITGEIDKAAEDKLNLHLNHNGELRFILYKGNDKMAISMDEADRYRSGDSMLVNTSENKLKFFRGNEIISEKKVTEALNGRPF